MGYFIDFITFTVKIDTSDPSEVFQIFWGLVPLETEEGTLQRGMNGYKQSISFPCGARVHFDGEAGMGIHIVLPGGALHNDHWEFDLKGLIEKMRDWELDYKISRIDVAIDTELPFGYFYNKVQRRLYDCRYSRESIKKYLDTENRGTLYFGKRGGLTMFRIYDKALEQGTEGNWTRVEMECRNEACEQIVEALEAGQVGRYFLGHLRFVDKREENMSRAKTSVKYLEVLQNPGPRMRVTAKKGDDTLLWFESQVAPIIKALERDYGTEYVRGVIDNSRISKRQLKQRFNMEIVNLDGTVVDEYGVKQKLYKIREVS